VNVKVREDLQDLRVDGEIILEWILENRVEICRLDASS
jgi:hypothetical protein